MKKYKYLLTNIGLLTLSSFSSKFLSFLLVPLYTSVLTTDQYGTYDIFNTTVMLLIPILTLGIFESVLRFSLDNNIDSRQVYSIGRRIFLEGLSLLIILLVLNYIFNIVPIVREYSWCLLFLYIATAYSQLLQYYARGEEKISLLSVFGIVSSIISLLLNILFLVGFRWGLLGYFYATILGLLIPSFYLAMSLQTWKYRKIAVDTKLKTKMLEYSKPMIINSVSWWINNSSSKYIIIWLCGISENGLYSVGYKIPTILNVFQQIFNQAWTLSSVKEFDRNDTDGFFARTYTVYNLSMILVCSVLIVMTKVLAQVIYMDKFYVAWKYVPFLMISIVFSANSGLLGGVFSAVKDSKKYSISTTLGAIVNILMSLIGVYFLGGIGAAIANCISFMIVWVVRLFFVKKYMVLKINLVRDCCAYTVLVVQSIVILQISRPELLYITEVILFLAIIVLYFKEFRILFDSLRKR